MGCHSKCESRIRTGEIVEWEPLNSDRFAKVSELHYDWMRQLARHWNGR
jgi:hypothetical protein